MNTSSLEQHIINLLNKEHIPFEREYVLKDYRNGLMRFDFYLPTRHVLVESHGLQHYDYKNNRKGQERDRLKIKYALINKIPLYSIPSWEVFKIKTVDGLFQEKFLTKDEYHNDRVWREHQGERKC